jgi:P4 family phage/plasmid primase-like protien
MPDGLGLMAHYPQTSSANLIDFLNERRVKDSSEKQHTVVGMPPHTGSYHVPSADYNEFLTLATKYIFDGGDTVRRPCGILEMRPDGAGPEVIDLDLHHEVGESREVVRYYRQHHVEAFVDGYYNLMQKYLEFDPETIFRFFVMEKAQGRIDGDVIKDGVHILCPEPRTTIDVQAALREAALEDKLVEKHFGDCHLKNRPAAVIDKATLRGNWFLYGAGKQNKPPYLLSYVIVYDAIHGRRIETADQYTPEDLMFRLSIRQHDGKSNYKVREDMQSEWNVIYERANSGLRKTASMGSVTGNSDIRGMMAALQQAMADTSAAGSGGAAGANPMREQVQEVTAAIEKAHGSKYTPEEIEMAKQMTLTCLSTKRATEWKLWMDVGWCLHNIDKSEAMFCVWMQFSQKYSGYRADYLAKHFSWWKNMRDEGLSMGTLHQWAKSDSPEMYQKIVMEDIVSLALKARENTPMSVARIVYHKYKHDYRCGVYSTQDWYAYRVNRWVKTDRGVGLRLHLSNDIYNIFNRAHEIILKQHYHVSNNKERDTIESQEEAFAKIKRSLNMTDFKNNVMREAAELFYDEDFVRKLDTAPYLLCTPNGVIDLRAKRMMVESGEAVECIQFRQGKPDDYLSLCTGVEYIEYDPTRPEYVEIHRFFEQIYPNPKVRKYVLQTLASCLEGINRGQEFQIWTGSGGNGKGQIIRLMELILGDYAEAVDPTLVTRKRPDSTQANPHMFKIMNKRFITMQEPDGNEPINYALVKAMTGGDIIKARLPFGQLVEFRVVGKIVFACNDMPPMPTSDGGTWRRTRVVKHVSRFVSNPSEDPKLNEFKVDPDLDEKMVAWGPAFLSLLVHIYDTEVRPARGKLVAPDEVMEASNQYQENNDVFLQFCTENIVRCGEGEVGDVREMDLKARWNEWKTESRMPGAFRVKPKDLFARVEKAFGTPDHTNSGLRVWRQFRLKPTDLDEPLVTTATAATVPVA